MTLFVVGCVLGVLGVALVVCLIFAAGTESEEGRR